MTYRSKFLFLVALATLAKGQRPSFAGSRPIGYPELITTTTEGLGNRFGEGDATTQRLPIEANGDRDLIDRLSKLPVDKQPFWFINWQAYEAHRQKPQTFPQKPNTFIEPTSGNTNFNQLPSNTQLNNRLNPASSVPQSTQFGSPQLENRFNPSPSEPQANQFNNNNLNTQNYPANHNGQPLNNQNGLSLNYPTGQMVYSPNGQAYYPNSVLYYTNGQPVFPTNVYVQQPQASNVNSQPNYAQNLPMNSNTQSSQLASTGTNQFQNRQLSHSALTQQHQHSHHASVAPTPPTTKHR